MRTALVSGAVAAAFGSNASRAQEPVAAATGGETQLTEVVVTGSRIRQPALEAISPVTSVTNAQIAQVGTSRIEDILNQLPQVVSDMGSALSNGSTGTATVSLRGLGCQRTLVLVNGRRLMPGDPTLGIGACADVNQIPTDLVERVDLLTGGASAVYGADAVAGVVNFVMNEHFEGVRFIAGDSFYNHSNHDKSAQASETAAGFPSPTDSVTDGQTADFTLLLGSNFDEGKGNATGYLSYRHTRGVLQGTRDYGACSLSGSTSVATRSCVGSGTTNPTRFSLNDPAAGYPKGHYSPGAGGVLVPTSSLPAGGLYNFAPLNYYQRPDDRYQGGFFAHYDFNDRARAYMEFQFTDDRTFAQIAPSGAFTGSGLATQNGIPTGAWAINCSNPYLSASEYAGFGCTGPAATNPNIVDITFGRRDVEGGPRTDDLGHTSFRTVVGLKGDINDVWNYDTFFQNGITRFSEEYTNDVSKLAMANALQAVRDPATGQIICAANLTGNNAPGCVPWNIFQPGGVTKAAVAYISIPGEQKGYTQELVWEGDVTGDLGKMGVQLPMAKSGLGLSLGADWRQEKSQLRPDQEFISNDLAGQGSPTLNTDGAFTVWEAYGEARLPILDDQPFAKSLNAEAGYRYSSYSLSFGSTNTWKLGLQWAPVQDVRVRANYNVAVRAPNIQELYLQNRVQLDGTQDPCASKGGAPAASAAACANTGVTAAEYGNIEANSANQYNGLIGGNVNLKPETARTQSLGLVITPQFLPSFNATIDYYDIDIKNVIGTYGANLILDNCLNTANPLFCSLVHRAPYVPGAASSGSLWLGTLGYINDGTYNLGELHQQGVDFELNYRLDAGLIGKFDFNLSGNYDLHFKQEPFVGSGSYDCAGYYGPSCGSDGGGMTPHIKTITRINYSTPLPGFDVFMRWRLLGPVKAQNISQNALLAAPPLLGAGLGTSVPGYNYIDLGVSYQATKQVNLRVGVNNIADKDPPIIATYYGTPVFQSGNTYPAVYDWGGRYLFANLTVDF